MRAIDNSEVLNILENSGTGAFAPLVTYSYDAGDQEIVLTEASTFADGDGLSICHLYVTDSQGKVAYDKITVAAGTKTIDMSTLDVTMGFNVTAMIVTTKAYMGDLGRYGIGSVAAASGSLGGVRISRESKN